MILSLQSAKNFRKIINQRILTHPCWGDPELIKHRHASHFIVSYPKCGRTWLRVLLTQYLASMTQENLNFTEDICDLSKTSNQVPYLGITHDFSSITNHKERIRYTARDLPQDKSIYKGKKIILLVRDLRDVLVSYYFDCTERNKVFSGTISDFIRNEYFGVEKAVNFLNIWYRNRQSPRDFLLLRYENLLSNTQSEFIRTIDFLDFPIQHDSVQRAVDLSCFDNMARMEESGQLSQSKRFASGETTSSLSRKVRRGKAFGFKDYLSHDDIQYLTDYINNNLSPFYGYTYFDYV
jgi:Sulfotransferase domain